MSVYYENPVYEGIRVLGIIFLFEHKIGHRTFDRIKWPQPPLIRARASSVREEHQDFQIDSELTPHFLANSLSPYLESLTDLQYIIDSLRDEPPSLVTVKSITADYVVDAVPQLVTGNQATLSEPSYTTARQRLEQEAEVMQRRLASQNIEIESSGIRVVMSGDQTITTLEINGTTNNELREVVNRAIRQSQELAARLLIESSASFLKEELAKLGEISKLREQAMTLQRQLASRVIEIESSGIRVVMSGDQTITTLEINGTPNRELPEIINSAIRESQRLSAEQLLEMSGSSS